MVMKTMSRRDFLKWLAAGAAAAGLSHFGVLNFGGVNPVLADACTDMADYCNPGEDLDVCPDSQPGSSDVCIPEMGELDECGGSEADTCDLTNVPPDNCNVPPGTLDQCEVPPGTPDTCNTVPDDVDVCPDAPGGDGDACSATLPSEPDECIPAVNEPDQCPGDAEPDFCRDPGTGQVAQDNCSPSPGDPDICWEGGQNVIDICDPGNGDDDAPPNATRVTSFQAQSVTTVLGGAAVVGAAVVALGAALTHSDET